MAENRQFGSRKDLVPAVARFIAERLERSIERNGRAGLVVSGGSTPKLVYPKLSQAKIAWEKVVVTLSDERIVPRTHEASNEGIVRRMLLQNEAEKAEFLSLLTNDKHPKDAEKTVESRFELMPWPTAVTLLGMGTDGHTASLFPQDASLAAALDRDSGRLAKAVLLPKPPPEAPYHRMTLTVPALLKTEQIILLITGEEKQDVLSDAFLNDDETHMPIRAFLHQSRVPVDIFWAP
ncbi:MAG: 6-phosphogluconolactonase [Rhodothalassiaceae bacterium]